MKRYLVTICIVVFAISFWNCEKDDICAEGTVTTPRLVIEFYDSASPTTLKNVTNLGVISPSFTEGFAFDAESKIEVPLRTNQDTTTLQFIENGSDSDTSNDNIDEITFNYIRQDIYISRACGYKTNFTLSDTNPIVITNDGNNWISSATIEQAIITNENEVHVKIYF